MKAQVNVWEEKMAIPTYAIGEPEKNPMFLQKRIYQGSSGVVYPHAVTEKISDEKKDQVYQAVFLENAYLKIMILPQLGGRIHMAYDKVKQRHFIYYNQVIKPALVGLTGPWISGGIEFNWPQHHRPSTFEAVDYTITENADGSKTIWVNEVERMFRTKGMAGFTLYPDKSYIEIKGRLYNRTPLPQTFLWWANPAVKVNDHYQSVFPPDVYAVFDHGRRDVSSFPIATGVYYKVDYAPGTDISRYKNIPVPTSYMAIASKYNFIGGYEHDTGGGLLHVADHHLSPGKKQWTWGHGEFGRAWDSNLTDEDGPYIEVMTGVYTDNQPDFSWIQPYEEKIFTQYFMPYREVGMVKNATKEAVLGVEFNGNTIYIKLYVTSPYQKLNVTLTDTQKLLFSREISSDPESPFLEEITLALAPVPEEVNIAVTDVNTGKVLVSYRQEKAAPAAIPLPAQAAKRPREVENNDQLYLTGLHLEQYRHATFVATDYYEEALKRDPDDVRNNNALGLWFLRQGKFEKATPYFRKAIATLTQRNPNPYDGEPYYNLGCALMMQGSLAEAFDAFYKSVWNDAWQHAGYLQLARIATAWHDDEQALELVDKSLVKNYHSHTARHLKTAVLRKLGKAAEAHAWIADSLAIDPFNFGCLFERYLLLKTAGQQQEASAALAALQQLAHHWVHNFIEYALDFAHAGLYPEAGELLTAYIADGKQVYPMVYYYLGWFALQSGHPEKGMDYLKKAAAAAPDFCFPNRIEDVVVLRQAILLQPADAKAPYYLGNFWYDKRQYSDAIACWEASVQKDDGFATVHRNLSLAYYNKLHDEPKALASMEKAFALDTTDARVLMELDQLYKKLHTPHTQRLAFLQQYLPLVTSREDLFLEMITLYNQLGEYETAKQRITSCKFHPWEGGEGKVVGQYLVCQIALAKNALANGRHEQALQLLQEATHYPPNLGEGKLAGAQENDIHYLQGLAYAQQGDHPLAEASFKKATEGISEPVQAIFYNDPQPDKIFYQGLAWQKLGDAAKAIIIFHKLIDFGNAHVNDTINIDYFAVSLPDLLVFDADLSLRNRIHCLYLMGLGNLGLSNGHTEKAEQLFDEVLSLDVNHQGALTHQQMAKQAALTGR